MYWRMEESELLSIIEERQKELQEAFVNGTITDWEKYLTIFNQYKGLEESKILIHEAYIRQNNGDNES